MTTLLFMISFIIHIVLLFIVYKLFQQIQALKQTKNSEMENLMNTFLIEIQEENNKLQRELHKKSQDESQNDSNDNSKHKKDMTVQTFELPVEKKNDEFSPSIQGQVYQLYDQGVPIEEIAKQLNRGKTEIELMVKFKNG